MARPLSGAMQIWASKHAVNQGYRGRNLEIARTETFSGPCWCTGGITETKFKGMIHQRRPTKWCIRRSATQTEYLIFLRKENARRRMIRVSESPDWWMLKFNVNGSYILMDVIDGWSVIRWWGGARSCSSGNEITHPWCFLAELCGLSVVVGLSAQVCSIKVSFQTDSQLNALELNKSEP